MNAQGFLRTFAEAVGESDNEFGGLFYTRLTTAAPVGVPLAATFTWSGALTVLAADTSELTAGDWIRLDSDGRYYEIESLVTDVSVTLLNPQSYPIPTGASQSSKALRTFPVESTLDWDDSGKFGVDGVVYRYASKTHTSFVGVSHVYGGLSVPGAFREHRLGSAVLDLNRSRTALDRVRRALLVAYAESEDLDRIGRMLSVPRSQILGNDALYRTLIQALAYNPRGTVYGLELVLNALVGAGNYRLYEDLIQNPNTVFVQIPLAATIGTGPEGKAFLSGPEPQKPASPTSLTLERAPIVNGVLHSVCWWPENTETDCHSQYPSAYLLAEYPGATPTPAWVYEGGTEGSDVILRSNMGGIQFMHPVLDGHYRRELRVTPDADIDVELVFRVPAGYAAETGYHTALSVSDGNREAAIIWRRDVLTDFWIGMGYRTIGGWSLSSAGIRLPCGASPIWYSVRLRKVRRDHWEWWLGTQRQWSGPYDTVSVDVATAERCVKFGITDNVSISYLIAKQILVAASDLTDLAAVYGDNAHRETATVIDLGASVLVAGDVGGRATLQGSAIVNANGGNNNGLWQIAGVPLASQMELDGLPQTEAVVATATPQRITVPATGQQFTYPDSLGHQIEISGSALGNDGTWTIVRLLEAGTLDELSWPGTTSICEVAGASFVSEVGLAWQLHPVFAIESGGLRYSIPGRSGVVGPVVTLRIPIPTLGPGFSAVVAALYSEVLSAQVLRDASVVSALGDQHAFYLFDFLSYISSYLDDVTAAGVIPEYSSME